MIYIQSDCNKNKLALTTPCCSVLFDQRQKVPDESGGYFEGDKCSYIYLYIYVVFYIKYNFYVKYGCGLYRHGLQIRASGGH